ncbi:hypothetical protein [Dankookia sp. P2]|uniref:hypothetical protein n=1 Tax=Dankookia sp. P2 TaxID=3423955 RepID=UPI003D67AE44
MRESSRLVGAFCGLAACLLLPGPALAAEDAAAPAQRLTGQASHSVLPAEPASLGWEAPGGTLWAKGKPPSTRPSRRRKRASSAAPSRSARGRNWR